jgi:copper chaperone CopZ
MAEQTASAGRTLTRNKHQRIFIAALCALTLTAAFFLVQSPRPAGAANSAGAVKPERVTVAIEGMSCTSCASGIKAMLKRTPGVISAEVSFERREADVEYDPERTTREKIVEAITKLGYKATVKG